MVQIWTPPYLTGNPNRPTIMGISNISPAYGTTFRLSYGYTQTGSTPAISRVVLNRIGGSTHSMHFDQRQVRHRQLLLHRSLWPKPVVCCLQMRQAASCLLPGCISRLLTAEAGQRL